MQQERGVRGLGGDPGDARDVDVGAARAVEEVEVREDRLAVAREADGQAALHLVEEQSLIAVDARGPRYLLAGPRRDEDLGLDPRDPDVRGLGHGRGKHSLFDQEHVGVELGALVAGTDHVDHAEEPDDAAVGQRGLDHDHVVELDVLPLGHPQPEVEGHRIDRAQDTTHCHTHADASR
jgi:hypothetical protein